MPHPEHKIGKLATQIGVSKGEHHQLRFMAFFKDCDREKCPISQHCDSKGNKGKCKVEHKFIVNLYRDWIDEIDGIGDKLNQIQIDRVGTHLMPLYLQLVRFSMEILTLDGMTYTNKAGTQAEYPQLKAQRDVLKHINSELKDLGLEKIWANKFNDRSMPGGKTIDLEKLARKGRSGSYDEKFGVSDEGNKK